jgi:diadenosine tetraphosphate (Ap4A) HIT family hydrolase
VASMTLRADFEDGCPFCVEFRSKEFTFDESLASRILFSTSTTTSFPPLGCFVEGYILVCPTRHVRSIASLGEVEFEQFLLEFQSLRSMVFKEFGPNVVFEHGMGDVEETAGGCIDHAHLHVVPGDGVVADALGSTAAFADPISWTELRRWSGSQYLLIDDAAGTGPRVAVPPANIRSQFLRQAAASALNVSGSFDWAVDIRLDNIVQTIARLR